MGDGVVGELSPEDSFLDLTVLELLCPLVGSLLTGDDGSDTTGLLGGLVLSLCLDSLDEAVFSCFVGVGEARSVGE